MYDVDILAVAYARINIFTIMEQFRLGQAPSPQKVK